MDFVNKDKPFEKERKNAQSDKELISENLPEVKSDSLFKRESTNGNLKISNGQYGGDPSPYKTKFQQTDLDFTFPSSIKIPRIEDLNIKLPRIEVPRIEVPSINFNDWICYLNDMNVD